MIRCLLPCRSLAGLLLPLLLLSACSREEPAGRNSDSVTVLESGRPEPSGTAPRLRRGGGSSVPARPASAEPQAQPDRLIVSGTVRLLDGTPVSSATLQLRNAMAEVAGGEPAGEDGVVARALSDADGAFRLEAPRAETYVLRALLAGYATVTQHVDGREDRQVEITLSRTGPLSGQVTDEQGRGIAGAWVQASTEWANGTRITTATEEGRFRFEDLPPGVAVTVSAAAEGFSPAAARSEAPSEGLRLPLRRGGAALEGRLLRRIGGEPVAGAPLRLQWERSFPLAPPQFTRTGEDGSFRFSVLAEGVHKLTLLPDASWTSRPEALPHFLRGLTVKTADETLSGILCTLPVEHTLAGVVRDAATSRPVEGVVITVTPADMGVTTQPVVTTGADGTWSVGGLRCDSAWVSAKKPGWYVESLNGQPPFDNDGANVPLEESTGTTATVDLTVRPGALIRGRVRARAGGAVPGAQLFVLESRESQTDDTFPGRSWPMDGDGRFEIAARPSARFYLKAAAPDYAPTYVENVRVPDTASGDAPEVDVVLDFGGRISGRVLEEGTSEPISGATVSAELLGGEVALSRRGDLLPSWKDDLGSVETRPDGTFELAGLPSGGIRLAAASGHHGLQRHQETSVIPLRPGEEVRGHEILLPRTGELSGIVTDLEERPLAGAIVQLWGDGYGPADSASTDLEGRFHLEADQGSNYSLQVEKEGYLEGGLEVALVGGDELRIRLLPDPAAQDGEGELPVLVVDAVTGEPVESFEVLDEDRNPNRDVAGAVRRDPAVPGFFRLVSRERPASFHVRIVAEGYVDEQELLSVPRGRPESPRTVQLTPAKAVRGRVVDGDTGRPVAGVKIVSSHRQRTEGTSDGDGRFFLPKVPFSGSTLTFIPASPYRVKRHSYTSTPGEETDLGDVKLESGGTLKGRLVRAPSGRPVSGVRVELDFREAGRIGEGAVTDEEGRFTFSGLGEEGFRIRVPAYRLLAVSDSPFEPGEKRSVTLELGETTLVGNAVSGGRPLQAHYQAGRTLPTHSELRRDEDAYRHDYDLLSDLAGRFELDALPPGEWTVSIRRVYGSDEERRSEVVEVPPFGTIARTFELPPESE